MMNNLFKKWWFWVVIVVLLVLLLAPLKACGHVPTGDGVVYSYHSYLKFLISGCPE